MLRRVSEFGSQKTPLFWPKIRFFELNYHFFEKKGIFEKKFLYQKTRNKISHKPVYVENQP
jgi:hypothetical protein